MYIYVYNMYFFVITFLLPKAPRPPPPVVLESARNDQIVVWHAQVTGKSGLLQGCLRLPWEAALGLGV